MEVQFSVPTASEQSQAAPFHEMDDNVKRKLEQLRLQTPRYLFRAWKNSHPNISGGYGTLNTTESIIPLAFRAGRGHSSVYDMSKDEFICMVIKHLDYEHVDFFTEFSSWAASLSFAMLFFGEPKDDIFISIIDTQALKAHNEIFFVPDLAFLTNSRKKTGPKLKIMHHEYLAHGPIRGHAHRAVPLSTFIRAGFDLQNLPLPGAKVKISRLRYVTTAEVQAARSVAQNYGYQFAAPVTLALLCLEERSLDLFLREGYAGLEAILEGLHGLHVPQSWSQDDTIMEDIVYFGNYTDVRQFIHLMRAITRFQVRNQSWQKIVLTEGDDNGGRGAKDVASERDRITSSHESKMVVIRFGKSKTKALRRILRPTSQRPVNKGGARVVKSASRVVLTVDPAKLARQMKELDLDTNESG